MRHPLGTARIAALSLINSELHTVSLNPEHHRQTDAVINRLLVQEPVLVYPREEALPVSTLAAQPVRPLLFIDASWRKSRRLLHQFPQIARLPACQLVDTKGSRYRIRREPSTGAISTLEAIAETLSVLEHEASKYKPMLSVMDWMIDQQIQHMGQDVYAANYAGKQGYQHD